MKNCGIFACAASLACTHRQTRTAAPRRFHQHPARVHARVRLGSRDALHYVLASTWAYTKKHLSAHSAISVSACTYAKNSATKRSTSTSVADRRACRVAGQLASTANYTWLCRNFRVRCAVRRPATHILRRRRARECHWSMAVQSQHLLRIPPAA